MYLLRDGELEMTHYNFMLEIQKYYGPYTNKTVKTDMAAYVKKTYYESELEQLIRNIKMHYSRKWKVVPDIAIIVETEKAYPLIQYIQGYRQIPDCEKKKQIEEDPEWKDYSKEISEIVAKFKNKQVQDMVERRKGMESESKRHDT